MENKNRKPKNHNNRPKDLEWINIEDNLSEESGAENNPPGKHSAQNQPQKRKPTVKKEVPKFNFHVLLLSLIAVIFVVIVFKLAFWDKRVRENNDMENDTTLSFDTEPLDSIVPLDASDTSKKEKDDDLRILFLGNGSLADDKSSAANIANIVQQKTGATVYNCSISGSYMSMKNATYDRSYSYDAFSFYFLCTLLNGNTKTVSWAERDLGGLPEDVKESLDLLQSIDLSELDILCIYYDGADYLEQRGCINLDNETDPTTFCGALSAGLILVQEVLPDTRIIVMSPTYAYVLDENGNYSSSYLTDILEIPFSAYIGFQGEVCMDYNVSFVDNFYGTVYEEIADEYLKDNILLNEKGHALVADRFLYALNRFHDYDF